MSATEENIIALFFSVYRRHQRYSQMMFGHPGPFQGQYRCLFLLDHRDEVSQRELADLLQIRPASVGEIISKLEHKGLIIRRSSSRDKRVQLVSLTPLGREEVRHARIERAQRHAELPAALSEEEKEQFCRLLKKINEHYMEMEKKDDKTDHAYRS